VDGESDPPEPDRRDPARAPERPLLLRRHRLSHLPPLKINRSVLESRYAAGCSTAACEGGCCRLGVLVDVAQRDEILAHVDLIQRAMDDSQERDPARWFEEEEREDPDFPSGRAVGTQVRESRCVFLDSARRCALQTATMAAAQPGLDLKPFFCTAFPVTIAAGTLWIDELCLEMPARCCQPAAGGPLDVLDVCEVELRHVLGSAGLGELRRLVAEHGSGRDVSEVPPGMQR
jgi:Fe-S-cluster containining protein